MSKIGVSLNIDVTAIDKSKMLKHENGKTYLDMTVFIDPVVEDNYGNHGMVVQAWKEAPKGGTPILGNAKIFWRETAQPAPKQISDPESQNDFDDDIPF